MLITPLFITFLFIVFILVWLFINTIDKRKWLTFLVSLILTPITYFYLFYPMLNIFSSYHHETYFNSETWKDKPQLRYEMANHILNDSLLIGQSKKSVIKLLGKSEWYHWGKDSKAPSKEKWTYNMGFKPGAFNNTQECLELQFKNNKVELVRSYQLNKEFE